MPIVRALMLAVAIAGCSGPAAFEAATPEDFSSYLEGFGQRFTPRLAPLDAADWHAAVRGFPPPTAQVASATYGEVTCVDPSKNCAKRGLVRPNETRAIWVVGFVVDAPAADGCFMWATVDARTGEFINGDGPTCR